MSVAHIKLQALDNTVRTVDDEAGFREVASVHGHPCSLAGVDPHALARQFAASGEMLQMLIAFCRQMDAGIAVTPPEQRQHLTAQRDRVRELIIRAGGEP
jgi:hypothetical protein